MRSLLLTLLFPALASAQENDAEKLFRDFETRIKNAKAVEVAFDIEHEKRQLKGDLLLTKDHEVRLKVSGNFGDGGKMTLDVVSDGKQIALKKIGKGVGGGSSGPAPKIHPLAAATMARGGLWLTTMSLARGPGIDARELDPEKQRLETYDFKMGPNEKIKERDAKVITYRLGQKADAPWQAAEVTLWLDAKTTLPLKRVVFQRQGKDGREGIRITETYATFNLDPKIDAKAFEVRK